MCRERGVGGIKRQREREKRRQSRTLGDAGRGKRISSPVFFWGIAGSLPRGPVTTSLIADYGCTFSQGRETHRGGISPARRFSRNGLVPVWRDRAPHGMSLSQESFPNLPATEHMPQIDEAWTDGILIITPLSMNYFVTSMLGLSSLSGPRAKPFGDNVQCETGYDQFQAPCT